MRREDTVVAPMPTFVAPVHPSQWEHQDTRVEPFPAPGAGGTARAVQPATRMVPVVPLPRPAPTPTPALPPPSVPTQEAVVTHGKIVVVFGCRGGAGATTLAVNIGATLARSGKSTCLVDLDLQLGDVFVALDLEPSTSVAKLAREANTIDGAALRRRLQRHDSGLHALTQVGRLDDIDPQLAERMPALLATLCEHFEYVVVDGIRDFGDHALAALDMADRIALVVTQDVPAIRRATRVVDLFRKLGYSERKIQLVVNRHVQRSVVSEVEIERALGLPIFARVRNDYRRMSAALDDGALLHDIARGCGVTQDVECLAGVLTSEPRAPQKCQQAPKKGLFSRLLSRGDK
ncbi:MAG: AAA family ATPase [Deltaproteobacteria bacterium]|nr:AAA family ATPase [Deltaproteobacteria bacterium]